MKRTTLALAALSVFFACQLSVSAATIILGPGLGNPLVNHNQSATSVTLSNANNYILTGIYRVQTGKSLTIEPGTIILCDVGSCLVIEPGAQIFANGSVTAPIVFTSAKPIGQRAAGDWCGVVILGNAPVNQSPPVIEGGITQGTYGGSNPNDNSGVFKYVRIEYAGYVASLNNEINGLTCGGVGRGTELHHVQISYGKDDSFEFFGGTVDANYLVAFGGVDDDFDTDFGYSGRLQFCFGLRDLNAWDVSGESNGFESDNEGTSPYDKTPRTHPYFSNVTLVGPKRTNAITWTATHKFQYTAVIRRLTECSIYNSIMTGYPGGLSIRDAGTVDAATVTGILHARNISMGAFGQDAYTSSFDNIHTNVSGRLTEVENWFNGVTPFVDYDNWGGNRLAQPDSMFLADMSLLNNPDPRPTTNTPDYNTVEFTALNGLTSNYFTPTTYRGAFDPSLPMSQQWTAGWTNFDPQNTYYSFTGWNMVSVPRLLPDMTPGAALPNGGPVWGFSGSYSNPSPLVNGTGYWQFFTSTDRKDTRFAGTAVATTSFSCATPGWYIVGSRSASVPTSAITVSPGTAPGPYWWWNGSAYVTVTSIDPGMAVWIYVTAAPCTITLP